MKNDLSQGGAAVYTARRRNKSIWLRSCMILALVVVMLTGYALIFPARTVEKELICGKAEHTHDENCYLSALTCGQEESETHTHSKACYTTVLVCGMEEHLHTEDCYAEPEPVPELTEPAETELQTEPAATEEEPAPETELPQPDPENPVETSPEETAEPQPEKQEDGDAIINFPETGIDLAPYLDSAVFQRQEGGAFVEDTWFENGETVKAAIIYDIPVGIVTPASKYVYYQLPEGIRPIEQTSGDVLDDGVAVGVYTITEDGVIHILFNDEFANGNAIMGTVEFSCYLYAKEDGSERVIEFENDAGSITVYVPDEQKYDLSLEKTGQLSEDYTRAEFVLTVSTEKGSGEPITVSDRLTNQTPATLFSAVYDSDAFAIRHVDANGEVSLVTDYGVVWGEDGMSFLVEKLPPLQAGEAYELVYSVELDPDLSGSFELDNDARAVAGELEAETTFFVTYVCDITKSGTFNASTGLIDWVITVNPESRPVAGWRIEDTLPYPAVGRVLLTNANGVRYADITPEDGRSIRYTFPANAPARPYFIRYSTTAPTTAETVRNEVRLVNERDTTVVAEVDVEERAEGVDKTLGSKHVTPDGMVQTLWSFRVTMPVGELDAYSFRDNISTPVMDVNNGEYLDSKLHFAYAAELEDALRGNLRLISDGKAWYYGDEENTYVRFVLSYFDAAGNPVEPTDKTTHVSRVLFELIPLETSFHGYEIVADDYPTWLDATGAKEGDYWSYQNYLYLRGGVYDVVPGFYRKGNAFEKQVRADGKFSSEDAWVDYRLSGGELEYRLLLDLTAMTEDSFTVTDLLPAGLELVEDSPRAFFTGANLHGEYNGSFGKEGSFSWTATPGQDGTTELSFTGTGITEQMKQSYAYVGIVYKVRLSDESLWNDYTHSVQSFTNTATWTDYTCTQTTVVENQPKRLEKNGVQLTDEEGNPLNRIRFTVLINAGAEDLDPQSDWITLTDRFSSAIGANLELSSVRLYRYDPTRPENIGNRVMPYEFRLAFNADEKKLTLELPDETAYVLVYDYSVDYTAILDGKTTVSNRAALTGEFSAATELALRGVSSSATAWQRVITITKVDADNNAIVLPGAEFLLEYWDPEQQLWTRMVTEGDDGIYETNEAGKIVLTLIGSEKDLVSSTLYRLTEIKAPAGYSLEDTVIWFLCMPKSAYNRQEIFDEAAQGSGVEIDEVNFFSSTGGTCIVTNPFDGLTVNKRWFSYEGEEQTDPLADYVSVTLYVSADPTGETGRTKVPASDTVENPVLLSRENDWSYTWGQLPAGDENGNPLYYFAEEDPVPGYTPRYVNNGINGGTIVICNDSEPYELPDTGSSGTRQVVGFGAMLMLLAAVVFIEIKLNKTEETT